MKAYSATTTLLASLAVVVIVTYVLFGCVSVAPVAPKEEPVAPAQPSPPPTPPLSEDDVFNAEFDECWAIRQECLKTNTDKVCWPPHEECVIKAYRKLKKAREEKLDEA